MEITTSLHSDLAFRYLQCMWKGQDIPLPAFLQGNSCFHFWELCFCSRDPVFVLGNSVFISVILFSLQDFPCLLPLLTCTGLQCTSLTDQTVHTSTKNSTAYNSYAYSILLHTILYYGGKVVRCAMHPSQLTGLPRYRLLRSREPKL